MFPPVAEPNCQSIWKLSTRSRQPSLAPTKPQLTRAKPQLAAIASDHWFFQASSILRPAISTRARRVPRSAAIQMRRQQRIHLEPRQQILVALPAARADSTTQWCGSQMISLVSAVPALGIAIHIPDPQRLRVDVLEGRDQVALFLVRQSVSPSVTRNSMSRTWARSMVGW